MYCPGEGKILDLSLFYGNKKSDGFEINILFYTEINILFYKDYLSSGIKAQIVIRLFFSVVQVEFLFFFFLVFNEIVLLCEYWLIVEDVEQY